MIIYKCFLCDPQWRTKKTFLYKWLKIPARLLCENEDLHQTGLSFQETRIVSSLKDDLVFLFFFEFDSLE